jgi:hypothetical protein
MLVTVCDRISYEISKREITDEGFLRVPGRVARVGIQDYLASELGVTDTSPNDIIKVYRPEESVFDQASLDSYNGADVTIEHPSGFVTPDTYRSVSVGTVRGSASRDGDYVVADLVIKDKAGIEAVDSGKVQLSAGYSAVYDDENVPADLKAQGVRFIQRNIKVNHVALVDRARAGALARLFDGKAEVAPMPVKITLDTGRTVELADEATAALIGDAFDRLLKRVKDAEEMSEEEKAKAEMEAQSKDEALKKSSDSAIMERVKGVLDTLASARKKVGADFTCDSVDVSAIQRAALVKACPGIDWADKSAVYVQAAWDMLPDEEEKKEEESTDSLKRLAADAAKTPVKIGDARAKYNADMGSAWRKTAEGK